MITFYPPATLAEKQYLSHESEWGGNRSHPGKEGKSTGPKSVEMGRTEGRVHYPFISHNAVHLLSQTQNG